MHCRWRSLFASMPAKGADRKEKGRGREMTSFDETPEHGWRLHRLVEDRAREAAGFRVTRRGLEKIA